MLTVQNVSPCRMFQNGAYARARIAYVRHCTPHGVSSAAEVTMLRNAVRSLFFVAWLSVIQSFDKGKNFVLLKEPSERKMTNRAPQKNISEQISYIVGCLFAHLYGGPIAKRCAKKISKKFVDKKTLFTFALMKLIKGCLITIIALILLVILFYLLIPIIAVYG